MSKAEILVTTIGEMSDMMACDAIAHGRVKERKHLTLDEVLKLR